MAQIEQPRTARFPWISWSSQAGSLRSGYHLPAAGFCQCTLGNEPSDPALRIDKQNRSLETESQVGKHTRTSRTGPFSHILTGAPFASWLTGFAAPDMRHLVRRSGSTGSESFSATDGPCSDGSRSTAMRTLWTGVFRRRGMRCCGSCSLMVLRSVRLICPSWDLDLVPSLIPKVSFIYLAD